MESSGSSVPTSARASAVGTSRSGFESARSGPPTSRAYSESFEQYSESFERYSADEFFAPDVVDGLGLLQVVVDVAQRFTTSGFRSWTRRPPTMRRRPDSLSPGSSEAGAEDEEDEAVAVTAVYDDSFEEASSRRPGLAPEPEQPPAAAAAQDFVPESDFVLKQDYLRRSVLALRARLEGPVRSGPGRPSAARAKRAPLPPPGPEEEEAAAALLDRLRAGGRPPAPPRRWPLRAAVAAAGPGEGAAVRPGALERLRAQAALARLRAAVEEEEAGGRQAPAAAGAGEPGRVFCERAAGRLRRRLEAAEGARRVRRGELELWADPAVAVARTLPPPAPPPAPREPAAAGAGEGAWEGGGGQLGRLEAVRLLAECRALLDAAAARGLPRGAPDARPPARPPPDGAAVAAQLAACRQLRAEAAGRGWAGPLFPRRASPRREVEPRPEDGGAASAPEAVAAALARSRALREAAAGPPAPAPLEAHA